MIFLCFFQERGWGGQQEVRSCEFDFLICCGCLLSWASLFPSLCLSFFLCNIMLMSLCCIWVLSVELGWRDRQGPKFSLPVGQTVCDGGKQFSSVFAGLQMHRLHLCCVLGWMIIGKIWMCSAFLASPGFLHGGPLGKGYFRLTQAHGNNRHLFPL